MVDRCKDRHRFELERRKDKLTFRPRKALTWVVVSVKMYTKLRRGCVLGRNEGKKDRKEERKIGKRRERYILFCIVGLDVCIFHV